MAQDRAWLSQDAQAEAYATSYVQMVDQPQSVPTHRHANPSAVNVSRAERIFEVVWEDGHISRFKTTDLRSLCDCANCREDREKKEDQPAAGRSLPVLGSADRADIVSVNHVGRYAFGVGWKDGHQSIYTYDSLLASCPCELCASSRRASLSIA